METLDAQSLEATQQAAWAAQSAAEAAWWGLLLSGVGAAAGIGALIWTIRITQADRRRSVRKDGLFLHSAASLLRDVYNQIEDFHEEEEDREEEIGTCGDRLRVMSDDQIFEQLIEIKLRDFPSHSSFLAFARARANAQLAKTLLSGGLAHPVDRGQLFGLSGSLLIDIQRLENEGDDPDYNRFTRVQWLVIKLQICLRDVRKKLGWAARS